MFICISGPMFVRFTLFDSNEITDNFSRIAVFCLVLITIYHGFAVKKDKPVTFTCSKENILEAKLLLVTLVILHYRATKWSFWVLSATLSKETRAQVFPVDLKNY